MAKKTGTYLSELNISSGVQPDQQRAVDEQRITQEQPVKGCVRQKGETALQIELKLSGTLASRCR